MTDTKQPNEQKPERSLKNDDTHPDLSTERFNHLNDSVLAATPRFSIMLVLSVHKQIGFTNLRLLLNLTPGNLDHHAKALIKEGFIEKYKRITLAPQKTDFRITEKGVRAFQIYSSNLKSVLDYLD